MSYSLRTIFVVLTVTAAAVFYGTRAGWLGCLFVMSVTASVAFLKVGWSWALNSDGDLWPQGKIGIAAYLVTPVLVIIGGIAVGIILMRGFASQPQWYFPVFPPL